MTLKQIASVWNRFFFEPQSPLPVCLFRIVFGLVVVMDVLLLRPEWLTWFGPRGLVTLASQQAIETGTRVNLFVFFPRSEIWSDALFWALLVSAICLAIGLFTRASSIAVFVLVASVQERNLFITNSGDTLLRCCAFFLMFAPAGAMLSVDRWRALRSGRERGGPMLRAPWAQRMIQIQLCVMYFMTFCNKSLGSAWVDGTAVYYVYHLDQFRRFPVPAILRSLSMMRLESWLTLGIEFSLGTLIWIKELRYPLLIMGVLLHLSLEYSMNVPMFQWTALAVYVTFVDAADLVKAWEWIRVRFAKSRLRGWPARTGQTTVGTESTAK